MENLSNKIQELTPIQRSFLVIEQLQSKLDKYERSSKEPIAIIGMGCRFPGGADNPASFWNLLSQGIDAISEIPSERWNIDQYYDPNPETPGKMYTRYGGFVGQLQEFDSHFFNIAPIEAISLDPQQRLLLEVSWEALEHAAIAPQQLAKTQTGVFMGICSNDYGQGLTSRDVKEIDAYLATGNAHSTATGRLSHFLGLTGPSLAVDTACSSSLVSVHLACASLRNRECNLALAGGVNRIISPENSINFSRARMLSPDGRCKTFDAGADGFVRGEGCGVVVLKRLSDAVADRDKILAVIRGTAINQDGHTSGLTVPNGPAQESVIRQALTNGGVQPEQVSYIEAHGTGTSLGDPIEVTALGNVFRESHSSQQPMIIGSVKTNIGHLEAAAGIAGLIKVVLQLQHQQIAPHLHFDQPNSYINWEQLPVLVPTDGTPWEIEDKPRLAGLSSFGLSGTNAHVIVEEAPSSVNTEHLSDTSRERPVHLLTLSTKDDLALWELVQKYQEFLEKNGTANLADICFTANTGRSHFQHRLAIIASNQEELAEKLAKARATEDVSSVFTGIIPSSNSSPKIALLFTGQGSQYVNMGRQLYDTEPIFRQTLDQCHQILQSYLEKPLKEVIYPQQPQDINTSDINQTTYTQPALFAIEYALFKLWQSWGINPDVVMGHSVGEYVAATVAGVFSLEDGLKLIATRGRLMQQLPCEGEMVSVMAKNSKVRQFLKTYTEKVALAAINGPESVVISGETEAIEAIISSLESEGIKTKRLQVSHPFHSPLMAPMLAEFETVANQITYHQPKIPVISNVTGFQADKTIATAKYWVNHVLEPVRFAQSMETLHQQGYEIFLEIGPKPILLGMGRQCLPEEFGVWLPSLREGVEEWQEILSSLGQLYVAGVKVDWSGFDREYARQKVVLPTYPFQRERYWIESNKSNRKKPYLSTEKNLHPLLGKRFYCAGQPQQVQFESLLAEDEPAYLKHHRVFDRALFPTTAYLEIALAAGVNRFKTDNLVVEDLVIPTGLILPEGEIKTVQTILTPSENQTYQWQVFTQQQQPNQEEPQWILHANGKIRAAEMDNGVATFDLEKYLSECSQPIEIPDHYQQYRQRGIEYGNSFQGIQQLWKGSNQALGKIELSPDLLPEVTDYQFHPALLDGALQVLIHALPQTNTNQTYLPIGIEQLKVYSRPGLSVWAIASVTIETQENWTATLTLVNEKGEILATLFGLQVKLATPESLLGTEAFALSNCLYEVQWQHKGRFGRLLPPTYLPSLVEISQKLNPTLDQLSSQTDNDNYGQLLTDLDKLSVEFVLQAFREMGWSYPVGKNFSAIEAIQQIRIVPSHHRLFSRLLEMLGEVGILKKTEEQWQVQQELGETNPTEKTKTLLSQYPQAQAELTLLNRCASQLSAVLRGAIDPVQLVFPEGDLTTATQLYQDSPAAKVMNSLVEKAIATALEKLPPQRGVRLLEIGAGTGGTTSYILPHLPPDQSEYVFTDIGTLFTAIAQEKFRDYPFVSYQTLDIEQDPTNQGFIAHQYDLIIAANVLHATTSLEQTLCHVRQLLAPGGILVLLEATTRQGWVDLIFGLLEGWWKFQDLELRGDYPLLSRSKWKQLLRETGFTEVVTLPETDGVPTVLSQQAVIIAQLEETTIEKTSSEPKGWLILADQQGIAQKVATQLRSSGQVCTLVFAGEKYQQIAAEEITINPHNPEEFKELVAHLKAQLPSLYGVVQCWTTEAGIGKNISSQELENLSQLGCGTTLSLVQALVKAEFSSPPRLWLVTQGAQPVPETAALIPGVVQSSVWGLAKVISLEHPELNCVRIDLDPQDTLEHQAWELFSEIWSEDKEDQVALRGKTRYVPRLVSSRQAQAEVSLSFRDDASYLITGGLGGIGLLVARWMVERGAKHLVLLGRSSPDETARKKLTELEQTGAFVVVEKADVSDLESMTRVMSNIEQSNLPLAGVIHSAGMLSDGILQNQNWSSFEKVMAPKVQGAWHLHQLTKNQPMDFFVLFSSAASLFGSPGQGNHAAANAFLDGLAHYRRGLGLSGLSIHWGAVSQVGVAAERSADLAELKGMGVIYPIQVLESLELLMSSSNVEVGVVPIKWSAWQDRVAQWLFLSDWHQTTHAYDHTSESLKCSLLQQLKTAVPSERREILVAHVRRQVAEVLGLNSSQQVDLKQGFFDLGMDSLMAVDFRNRLQKSLECYLPSTLTFKYPDLAALIDYLTTEVFANYFSVTLEDKENKVQEKKSSSSRFQEMSEDEMAKLLAQKIEDLE
ncbi:SDR family NAD(P)-dependent oxidoreductase [Moorena producens JHB]|uniref:SDR family NAD(P)-dependent oxidoreductase n=1 Tax=Moorena producens (strain JHB) TaxID=1454205 RepID=A0A9Q9ST80_MOOP1|nr:type I polyketide synthase [Moorena producens]WAN69217.1 SDR family NAD(P)-dependent oxidoreductase [Moorena producens JHB]